MRAGDRVRVRRWLRRPLTGVVDFIDSDAGGAAAKPGFSVRLTGTKARWTWFASSAVPRLELIDRGLPPTAMSEAGASPFWPPPHLDAIRVEKGCVMLTASPETNPAMLRAEGGTPSSKRGGAWKYPAADDRAVGAVLQRLRDRGIAFRSIDGEWTPAEVFEEYRKRGLVSGRARVVTYHGQGKWLLRERL